MCAAAVHDVRGLATIPLLAFVGGGLLIVVLSETTARDAGERAGAAGLARTRVFVETMERGLAAVVMLGEWVDTGLANALPPEPADKLEDEESVARFRQVVSTEAGVSTRESALLTGVFALGDTTVADVMTPRTDIVGLEHDATWHDAVARVRSSEHARIVVYGSSLDDVVGVLYAKDLLPFIASDEPPPKGWLALVRPATFIPASKRVDAQLRDFRASHQHIAIVADEFGGTAGLVTIEDILELIVGEIRDEHDVEEPEFQQQDGARYWVAGRLTLDQLSDYLGDDLRRDDVNTVGGLAYELFGRVPHAGENAEYRSWRLIVERVRGRRVERVYLERLGVAVGAEDGA
jgi:CBS domain containing-hemolysin-like protein